MDQPAAKPLPGAENAGKPGYYTVRPGDTLIRIALETGQNWRDIARWNSLDNPNVIEVGQVLRVVPPVAAATAPAYPASDVAVAKEYIENHWLEEFDMDSIAQAVSLSRYHFARLFKKHTGMTPYSYYQDIKLRRLKEALCNTNLSITEAFATCGMAYSGNFARVFREKVGMTPSQYRKSMQH